MDVTWTRPCQNWTVDNYNLSFTDTKTGRVDYYHIYECEEDQCTQEDVSGLRACVIYEANQIAYQYYGNATVHYTPQVFETKEDSPSGVQYLHSTGQGQTFIDLFWYPPYANSECVSHYEVCYQAEELGSVKNCENTPSVDDPEAQYYYTLNNLEPCANYYITVTPKTPKGKTGDLANLEQRTLDASKYL